VRPLRAQRLFLGCVRSCRRRARAARGPERLLSKRPCDAARLRREGKRQPSLVGKPAAGFSGARGARRWRRGLSRGNLRPPRTWRDLPERSRLARRAPAPRACSPLAVRASELTPGATAYGGRGRAGRSRGPLPPLRVDAPTMAVAPIYAVDAASAPLLGAPKSK